MKLLLRITVVHSKSYVIAVAYAMPNKILNMTCCCNLEQCNSKELPQQLYMFRHWFSDWFSAITMVSLPLNSAENAYAYWLGFAKPIASIW